MVKSLIKHGFVVFVTFLIAGAFCFNQSSCAQEGSAYKDFEHLQSSLKALVKSNVKLAELESIGKSSEGRDIWLATIANKTGIPVSERPGLLISANLEGDHLIGSELAMRSMEYLLNNYGSDESVKKALDEHVIYFLPRINPDGAEKNFNSLVVGAKTNSTPYDGDNDGRMDEDGPEDLNGDGLISFMRVKDPNGLYMLDAENPALLKKADPVKGESGGYSIYWEGIDNDKDGFINEDPAGGIDINRNFQHAYPYNESDAGIHMVSEKETRAVLDWMLANKNIAIMLSFSESDNLISPPGSKGELNSDKAVSLIQIANTSFAGASKVGMVSTSRGFGMGMYGGMRFSRQGQSQSQASSGRSSRPARKPATTINKEDQEYFTLFSKKYKEITGIETQPFVRKPEGAMFEYGYYQYGVPSLSTPGWGMDMPKDTSKREAMTERPSTERRGQSMRGGGSAMSGGGSGADATIFKWFEKNNPDGIIKWQSVDHPDFEDAEVGGFNLMDLVNPPVEMLDKLGKKHGEFMVYLSSLYPDVNIAETEVLNHGGGIFRIKAEIENSGFLPTALAHGVVSRGVKPTMVQLGVDPDAIMSGSSKNNYIQKLEGSGKRHKYEWLIKGKSGDRIELKVVAQKGGSDTVTIVLK